MEKSCLIDLSLIYRQAYDFPTVDACSLLKSITENLLLYAFCNDWGEVNGNRLRKINSHFIIEINHYDFYTSIDLVG